MGGEYEYRVVDRSLLAPILRRWLWTPVVEALPKRVAADALSRMGAVFSGLSLLLLSLGRTPTLLTGAAICILLAVNLDYLDGMQARRLGTAGPAGEYLDHWLDSLSAGCVFWGAAIVYDAGGLTSVLLVSLGLLSYTGAFWIQHQKDRLELDAIGALESAFIQAGIYFWVAQVGVDWFDAPRLGPVSVFDLLLAYAVFSSGRLVVLSFSRRTGAPITLIFPAAHVALTGVWALLAHVPLWMGLVAVILMAVIVNGDLVASRIKKERPALIEPIRGLVLAAAFLTLGLPRFVHGLAGAGLIVILAAYAAWDFRRTRRSFDTIGEADEL